MSTVDLRIEALNIAARALAGSNEINAKKLAAQIVYVAELILPYIEEGKVPEYEGNLDIIYRVIGPNKKRRATNTSYSNQSYRKPREY